MSGGYGFRGDEECLVRDVEAEARRAKRHARIGEFVCALSQGAGTRGLAEGVLVSVKARFPTEEEPSTLLVVRARSEEGAVIAFVGAYSLGDALLAWRARVSAGSMKWREDVPWEQR